MKILCLIIVLSFAAHTEAQIKEQIGKFLGRNLKGYEKIDFEIASAPAAAAGESLAVDTLKELRVNGALAYIPVSMLSKDRKVSQSYLTVKLSLYKKVLTALTSVQAGKELSKEEFELKTLDLAKLRGVPVCEFEELNGLRAKFNIKEGEVLLKEKLQPVPVVKKGDSVTAVAVRGNVEISMDAAARQDGGIGEIIRIITPDKKIFRARVIDQFSVNIIE